MANPIRKALADQFIKGVGIEIGALHNPFPVPKNINLTYVDRLSQAELKKHYPELGNANFPYAVVDDGETLKTFKDSSLDFIIASHFIEHTQNPIGTLENFNRVLKLDGIALLVIPDRRATFDRERNPTSWEHVYADYKNGPQHSYEAHLNEWAALVEHAVDVQSRVDELRRIQYSIHFHVWTNHEFIYFLNKLVELMPLHVVHFQSVTDEMYAVLQKKSDKARPYDEGAYLINNLDVRQAVMRGQFSCGFEHWLKHGKYENR